MPRIRTIKPEFFLNDKIAELKPLERIFFIGLWTQADRLGRLEDRPKRLKAAILPYDNFNIEQALENLSNSGFICRYSENGNNYIEILTFLRHQYPNIKEPDSIIPAPSLHDTSIAHSGKEGKGREGKGREGKEDTLSSGKKPPSDPQVKIFIDYAYQTFLSTKKEKLHIDGGKDGKTIKSLLGTYGIEKLKELWDKFISSEDDFILKAGFSIGVFKSQINKLVSGGQNGTGRERFTKAGGIKPPVGKYDGLEIKASTGSDKSGKL